MALFVWPPQNINTTGLATEAKQDVTNTKLDTLIAKDFATSAKQDTLAGKIDTLNAKDFATSAKQDTLAGKVDSTNTKLDTLIAKDFATETTLQKTRKWPYATFAKIVPTSDVNNEYYTYKTSGDVTVGTITKAIATGIVTYSPDKVV